MRSKNNSYEKFTKFIFLIALSSLLACCGESEPKTTESKTDSIENKAENKPTKEKKEEEQAENNDSSKKDGFLNRSLVGRWEYESGEAAGELDGGRFNFTTEEKFNVGEGSHNFSF